MFKLSITDPIYEGRRFQRCCNNTPTEIENLGSKCVTAITQISVSSRFFVVQWSNKMELSVRRVPRRERPDSASSLRGIEPPLRNAPASYGSTLSCPLLWSAQSSIVYISLTECDGS